MLQEVLNKHYLNYQNQSVENIKRDAKGLLHIISDYEGRVVFELLQNAFDKAEKHIGIIIKNDVLYLANDGEKFSYILDFDYENGHNEKRGDFQSICSVYTSTKTVSGSIGNKGIGFKSVFSVAKNQDGNTTGFPTRFVEIYTNGQFIDRNGNITEETCGFQLFEMFRSPSWLNILDDGNITKKIESAQKEYPDTGIPGYYYPLEVSNRTEIVTTLLKRFQTVVAIPLENPDETKKLLKEKLIDSKIHFQFIQLKYAKEFEIEIEIEDETALLQKVDIRNNCLIYQHVDNEELKTLAQKAGITITDISIGIYLREDNEGRFYNYLPTDRVSPFPFVDFHADFHTTLNRKDINWDGAVGNYNKGLLQACIELLFSSWKNDEDKFFTTKYIDYKTVNCNMPWKAKYIDPAFKIESAETLILRSIFEIKDDRWQVNFKGLTNWIAENISTYFVTKNEENYTALYTIIANVCNAITTDYNLSAWSRLEGFMADLKASFIEKSIDCLPRIKTQKEQEIFYVRENVQITPLVNIKFTAVELPNGYAADKLRKALNIKDYNDVNEVFKKFKQCVYNDEVPIKEARSITEEEQIIILQNVYTLFERKNEKENLFFHRYETVLSTDLRIKNSVRNQANFNVSTLFLKTIDGRYKPAQLCQLGELDENFRDTLKVSEEFLKYIGVSDKTGYKVYDNRIYQRYNQGLINIPMLVDTTLVRDPIDENIVNNCLVKIGKYAAHPALINDNYPELFQNSRRLTDFKPALELFKVKKYNQFSVEYFKILKDYLAKSFNNINNYEVIKSFYPSVFELFQNQKIYMIFNGSTIECCSNLNFFILKTKTDLEHAYKQGLAGFLIYEADRGLFNLEFLEKMVINFEEKIDYTEDSKIDITANIQQLLYPKLPFVLLDISSDNQSDRNYLENDYNLSEVLRLVKFFTVDNFKLSRKSEKFEYENTEKFKISNDEILLANELDKTISRVISQLLFSTTKYADKIEIVLYHRDIEELQDEYDKTYINILRNKFDPNYNKVVQLFLQRVNDQYPELDTNDIHWNKADNPSIKKIIEANRLLELNDFLQELRFQEDFKDFNLNFFIEINTQTEIKNPNVQNTIEYSSEVNFLVNKIATLQNEKNLLFANKNSGVVGTSNGQKFTKKIKNFNNTESSNEVLEAIGSNGEHEVLNFFVSKFVKLATEEKKLVINNVFCLIKKVIDDASYYENVKEKLIQNLGTNEELLYLIQLLFITYKYKFSYFDLIGFNDFKEVFFVEVKTTSNEFNKSFFISKAEVDCALAYENYQLVRVSPNAITFLGNPLVSFRDQLQGFQNNVYKLISTKFKIEILTND